MRLTDRPRIEIIPTYFDKVLDVLSLAGVIAPSAYFVVMWDKLPTRIPTHFGPFGAPDQWGQRSSLLLYVIAPIISYVALTIISQRPWIYNYPIKVTEENCQRLYFLGREMILWLRTETVWLFALLGLQTVRVALGQVKTLGPALSFGPLAVIFMTMAYYAVMMYRTRPGGLA